MNRLLCQLPIQVIFIILLILPLFWFPSFFSLFEGAKVGLFTLLVDIALGAYILYPYTTPLVRPRRNAVALLLSLFVAVSFISVFYNGTIRASLWGNPYRSDGLWTLVHLFLFSVLVSRYTSHTRVFLIAALTPYSFLTIWAVLTYFFHNLELPSARWGEGIALTMGNPNMLAGYLAVGSPFLYYAWESMKGTPVRTLPVILYIVTVSVALVNRSWGGLLTHGAFLVLLFTRLFFTAAARFQRRTRVLTAGIVLMACCAFTAVIFTSYTQETADRESATGMPVSETRARIFTKAALAIAAKPVIGWGWATFADTFRTLDWPVPYEVDSPVDRTHSSLLDIGVSNGLVGLALFLAVCYTAARSLWKSPGHTAHIFFMFMTLYLVHSQTNITSIAEDIFFYWAIGAAIGSDTRTYPPQTS